MEVCEMKRGKIDKKVGFKAFYSFVHDIFMTKKKLQSKYGRIQVSL